MSTGGGSGSSRPSDPKGKRKQRDSSPSPALRGRRRACRWQAPNGHRTGAALNDRIASGWEEEEMVVQDGGDQAVPGGVYQVLGMELKRHPLRFGLNATSRGSSTYALHLSFPSCLFFSFLFFFFLARSTLAAPLPTIPPSGPSHTGRRRLRPRRKRPRPGRGEPGSVRRWSGRTTARSPRPREGAWSQTPRPRPSPNRPQEGARIQAPHLR